MPFSERWGIAVCFVFCTPLGNNRRRIFLRRTESTAAAPLRVRVMVLFLEKLWKLTRLRQLVLRVLCKSSEANAQFYCMAIHLCQCYARGYCTFLKKRRLFTFKGNCTIVRIMKLKKYCRSSLSLIVVYDPSKQCLGRCRFFQPFGTCCFTA